MCGTRRAGRPVKGITGWKSGLLSRRVRREITKGVEFTPLETSTANGEIRRFLTGFTLIELLMVISIITLLVALLLPALHRVRNHTKAVVCQTNLKQWGTILSIYVEENRGRLPSVFDAHLFLRGTFISEDDPNVPGPLNPFDTKGIACCPMAVRPSDNIQAIGSKFEAWVLRFDGPPFRGSYGFNQQLLSVISVDPFTRELLGLDVYSLKYRAKYPVLLDCKIPHGMVKDNREPPSERRSLGWGSFCMNRHHGYINGLFLDWSVRRIGLKELWTLKWYSDFDTSNPWTKTGGVQPEDWPEWMRNFKDY